MLNEQQFGKLKSKKPQGPAKPKKPKVPGQSSSGESGGYKFLPVPKSQEELDLIEAKAKALNHKTQKNLLQLLQNP
jgi:hypothetical protein